MLDSYLEPQLLEDLKKIDEQQKTLEQERRNLLQKRTELLSNKGYPFVVQNEPDGCCYDNDFRYVMAINHPRLLARMSKYSGGEWRIDDRKLSYLVRERDVERVVVTLEIPWGYEVELVPTFSF